MSTQDRDQAEFSPGAGMVDAPTRAARELKPHEQLWEIYATDPQDPTSDPSKSVIERP